MNRAITDQWGQGREVVLRELERRNLAVETPNPAHASLLLERAALNLATVDTFKGANPALAYDALYGRNRPNASAMVFATGAARLES